VSKVAKFSRANSMARAASAASSKSFSRAPSQPESGAGAKDGPAAPAADQQAPRGRAPDASSPLSSASSQALLADGPAAAEALSLAAQSASIQASAGQIEETSGGGELPFSRSPSKSSLGGQAQDNQLPGITPSRGLLNRPSSGRVQGVARIPAVASIIEEVSEQISAPASQPLAVPIPSMREEADSTPAGAAQANVVPSALSAFDKPAAATGAESGNLGGGDVAGSRVAAMRRRKDDKCANPSCKQYEDNDRKFDIKCGKCDKAKYCSKDCMRGHWIAHSKECGVDKTQRGGWAGHKIVGKQATVPPKGISDNVDRGTGVQSGETNVVSADGGLRRAQAARLPQNEKGAATGEKDQGAVLQDLQTRDRGGVPSKLVSGEETSGGAGGRGSESFGRLPSATHGLLKQVSSALQGVAVSESLFSESRPPSRAESFRQGSKPSTGEITESGSFQLPRTQSSAIPRTESTASNSGRVWDRVDTAMKEEVDEQGFKSLDDRLEYFLTHATVMRIKAGQNFFKAGSTGVSGKRFFLVWAGSVSIQKPSLKKNEGDSIEQQHAKSEEFPININGATQRTKGPDRRIRLDSGPGGPAAESKVGLRDLQCV